MSDVVLRAATQADAAAIAKLHQRSRAAGMPWLKSRHGAAQIRAFFRDSVLKGDVVTVAVRNPPGRREQLLGFVAVNGTWLNHLYVAPQAFGTGIALQLLDHARSQSPSLMLWVFARNLRARRFYAKHGFTLLHETAGAGNAEDEPDALYVWQRV